MEGLNKFTDEEKVGCRNKDEDVIPVGGFLMKQHTVISTILSVKPDKLIVKAVKKLRDFEATIIEVDEENRVLKFALPLKYYPFLAEFIEEYASTVEYQVLTIIFHDLSAAKLKEFYNRAKDILKLWIISPPQSYVRILGVIKTTHGNVMLEMYPRRTRRKGTIYLRYLGRKGDIIDSYTVLTQVVAFRQFQNRQTFYNEIDKASKALKIAEVIIRNILRSKS